ncbi:DUF3313 family protein [Verrucomicrobiaceae bacterium 227]
MSILRFLLIIPASFLFVSCNTALTPSGFLGKDDARMAKNPSLPFSRSWKNPEADLSKYQKIAVKPMMTDRLRPLGSGLSAASERNIGEIRKKDATEFASFTSGQFHTKLNESPGREATLSQSKSGSTKSEGTMILETNLVEFVPGKPAAQVVKLLFPFAGFLNRPSVGMEGRLVDAKSGKTLFAFSDRETPEPGFFDLQKFSYYGTQRREATRWAGQLRKVVEDNATTKVSDPFFIQPIAW